MAQIEHEGFALLLAVVDDVEAGAICCGTMAASAARPAAAIGLLRTASPRTRWA